MCVTVQVLLLTLMFLFSWTGVHAQNIGIGTPNPDYTLDINGDLGINDFVYHNDNDGTRFGFPAADQWQLEVNSQRMLLADGTQSTVAVNPEGQGVSFVVRGQTNGGVILMSDPANNYLGIGTTNPEYLLDISGPVRIVGDGIDHLFYADTDDDRIGIGTSDPQYLLDISGGDIRVTGDSYQHLFYIDAQNDQIGIGTSNPEYLLDVNGPVRIVGDGIDHLFFADPANDRIGIGTNNPSSGALIDVKGRLKVEELQIGDNASSFFQSIQTGSVIITDDAVSGSSEDVTVTFDTPFTNVPKIVATVHVLSNVGCCTFGVSVYNVSNNQVTLKVDRIDDDGDDPWSNNLQINWMAWE